jgi:DNA replication protein DnaC
MDNLEQRLPNHISLRSQPDSEPVCSACKGRRYYRTNAPLGHPQFGKLIPCTCVLQSRRQQRYRETLALCERAGFQQTKRIECYRSQVPGVQQAFKATKSFISWLQRWATAKEATVSQGTLAFSMPLPDYWLVLTGPVGVGKTHLLMALGNAALDAHISMLFFPVVDLLDEMRKTFDAQNDVSYDTFIDRLKNIDLLLLDDLGTEVATPWAREKLFQLLNYRYVQRLPTGITLNSKAWASLDTNLQSRLRDTSLVEVIGLEDAQDYRPQQERIAQIMAEAG